MRTTPSTALNRLPAVCLLLAVDSAKQCSTIFWILPVGQALGASTKTMSSDIRHGCLPSICGRARRYRCVRSEHKDKQGPLLAFFMVSSALLHAFGWLVNPDRHHSEAASRTSLNWSSM